jgi:hypothetical protein
MHGRMVSTRYAARKMPTDRETAMATALLMEKKCIARPAKNKNTEK